ncbi:hypothetical protein LCGC14_1352590, partial [marine sediment metagenome]
MTILINSSGSGASDLRLFDDAGGEFIALKAAGTTTTYTLTFPAADTAGALTSDGAGNLSFAAAATPSLLQDADGDTKVDVEEAGDDDIIRFDVGDTPTGFGAVADIMTLASSGWITNLGTANVATTVGAPITMTAGVGNTTGVGGAIAITGGLGGGGAGGIGGAVTLRGGQGGQPNDVLGGQVNLIGGRGGGANGAGADVVITSGLGVSFGGAGDVLLVGSDSGGSDDGGLITLSAGGGGNAFGGAGGDIILTAGNARAGDDRGGKIILNAGVQNGSGAVGFIEIQDNLLALDAAGPAILNEAATATNPTLIPNKADLTSGVG